ncbi:MAG: hypothetical protein JNM29_07795 [Candidatus Odyssella sp.]|nr:hypothetical protein [Candidatus Odyssella sp.]
MSDAQGLLAVWVDIPAPLEAEFNDWYDREHLAERAGIPGFRTARRYVADGAAPKYHALYETDSLAVFAAPEYRRYLGPLMTDWSKRIMGAFVNNHRRCCRFVAGAGGGIGGAVASLRFPASDALEARLAGGALAAALAPSGAVGAKAWRSDLAATFPDGPPRDAIAETVVEIEATGTGAANAGADALIAALRAAPAPAYRGTYRLLHALPA